MQQVERERVMKQVQAARACFERGDFSNALDKVKAANASHPSINLNQLLAQIKVSPQNGSVYLSQIANFTTDFALWNAVVLAQTLGKTKVATILANLALTRFRTLRTDIALMLIYQSLKAALSDHLHRTALTLLQKWSQIILYAKKLSPIQNHYNALIRIQSLRLPLRIYFDLNKEETKEGISKQEQAMYIVEEKFLKAQGELQRKEYVQCMKTLSEVGINHKVLLQNNLGIIISMRGQPTLGRALFDAALTRINWQGIGKDNLQAQNHQAIKENILLTTLLTRSPVSQNAYCELKNSALCTSFKANYRRAQICLNYYHELVRAGESAVAWAQEHDHYDVTYFPPNLPYFQKNKNKNPNYTNGKFFHRRLVLRQAKDNELQKEVLGQAERYLRHALAIIEKERKVKVEGKPCVDYDQWRGSTYVALCYTLLCKEQWTKVTHFACQYQLLQTVHPPTAAQKEQRHKIATYQMEAYCQLNRMNEAFNLLMGAVSFGTNTPITVHCPAPDNYFEETTQATALLCNIAVLHSRANRVAESYKAIENALNSMRVIPSNPAARLPKSLVNLLVHYNMRTCNMASALQMIKRKRILSYTPLLPYPLLNITK